MPKWTSAQTRAVSSSGPASTLACRVWTARSPGPWWTQRTEPARTRRPPSAISTWRSICPEWLYPPARRGRAASISNNWRVVVNTERKVAVVTGASQGIGAGLGRGFLDRGYRVVANSRSIKPSTSPDVHAVPGDIADSKVADKVIAGAVETFGRVDTLVNNAGVFVA